jgi:hypothetical protein
VEALADDRVTEREGGHEMPTVVVTGDLIWDFNLAQQTVSPIAHHEPLTSAVLHLRAGGDGRG